MHFADHEELAKRQKRRERQRRNDIIWNVLTGLVLLFTALLVGAMLIIFSNPQVSINPFPPPTLPVLVQLPTSTPTQVRMPATWTPTLKPTEPEIIVVTVTPQPSVTPESATATSYPTVNNGDYPFAVEGVPVAMANTVFHTSDATCDWQGVAGRVVDLQGKPLVGMLIKLTGTYNGRTIEMTTLSGGASAWYGESGYEFVLGTKAVDSRSTLAVQMLDQSLMPISARVLIDTYSTCDKNLTVVNFKQVR